MDAPLNDSQFAQYGTRVDCPKCNWTAVLPHHVANYARATHLNTQHVEHKGS